MGMNFEFLFWWRGGGGVQKEGPKWVVVDEKGFDG